MKKGDAIVVSGLGFGDEGKGTIVDALARRLGPADVIRYNGGPQAGHNVVDQDGRWHCFAQLGAGSFNGDSRTILGPKMLVELENLEVEMDALAEKGVTDIADRMTIDPGCLLITPMQKFVGRMREISRGKAPHGSCGQGVGETVNDAYLGNALTVGDIRFERPEGLRKLKHLSELKREEAITLWNATPLDAMRETFRLLINRSNAEELYRIYRRILGVADEFVKEAKQGVYDSAVRGRTLIFEGAQGALLDRQRGFQPYVTKSDTTGRNAIDLLQASNLMHLPFKLGVLRAYGHRHGAGPFMTEDESMRLRFDDRLNRQNLWQGKFRVGWLDLPALRYGIRMNGGVNGLAVTGLDRLNGLEKIRLCASYDDAEGSGVVDFPSDGRPLTEWITRCRPHEWIELPGWKKEISGLRRFGDLPKNAQTFIRFLESAEGLSAPVEIVSVGPRSDQKLFLRP